MKIRRFVCISLIFLAAILLTYGCKLKSTNNPRPAELQIYNSHNEPKLEKADFIDLQDLNHNLKNLSYTYKSLFPTLEITLDSAAIVELHSDIFANSYSQRKGKLEKYWMKFKGFEEIYFEEENYVFLFFHTLPVREYNSPESFELSECRWCNGYSSVVRLKKNIDTYIVDELIYDCKCGRRETWGSYEQGKLMSIGGKFLAMEAENNYWNNPVSISSVNICNALNLEHSRSFYQGGKSEDGVIETEMKPGVSSYVIVKGRPTIETKVGLNKYEDIGGLFGQKNPLVKRISHYITLCCDGTTSYSTGSGTCSWHNGVCDWKYPVYRNVPKYSYY